MRKGNISIFVPHLGCPCKCAFCNQKTITGQTKQPNASDVISAVEKALEKDSFSYEIAFFGGSFTAIDREYMLTLLEAAYPYVKSGKVQGIRISTRPDCIDNEMLDLLKRYGVTSIELGAQSMDDEVLLKNERGHASEDVVKASKLIKEKGFSLGLQMMTGLYGDTDEKASQTAKALISLKPDTVRIYPTVVLEGTRLAELMKSGEYQPQGFDGAVALCSRLVKMFEENSVRVIRLGLHSSDDVKSHMVGGAFHDSFGELVRSQMMLEDVLKFPVGEYTVFVNPKTLSRFIGNKRHNLIELQKLGYKIVYKTDTAVTCGEMRIENGIKNA